MNLAFLLVAASMPAWLKWAFWISPVTYGEIGLAVNEFLAPRWQKVKETEQPELLFLHSFTLSLLQHPKLERSNTLLILWVSILLVDNVHKHNTGT